MSEEVYNINEIIDFTSGPPVGDYVTKAVNVDSGETKAGDPKMVVTFDILEGEYRGTTFNKEYYLKQGKTKNGGTWCSGLSELRADARAIGALAKIPKSFTLPQARKIFIEVLCKKKLSMNVRKEPAYNDPSKFYNHYSVTGLAEAVQAEESSEYSEYLG
jgi:hypothetical protein